MREIVLPSWGLRRPAAVAASAAASARITIAAEPLRDLALAEQAWRMLEAEAEAPFFLTWQWIGTWLATLERPALLLRAQFQGDTVGLGILVPHRLIEQGAIPVHLLCLNATGDPARDVITIEYNGLLARRGLETEVAAAALDWLRVHRRVGGRGWDAVEIVGASSDSLPLLHARGYRVRTVARAASARVDLDAVRASGKPYLASLSANTRSQVRRAMRLYAERGELRLDAARDVSEALRFFEQAGELHQARWEARGRPGAFASPYFVSFHRRLITTGIPAGTIDLLRVSVAGEAIGLLYNLLHAGTVYFYLSGLRYEDDNRLKPGLVTHALAAEHYLARGFRIYDFMGGANRYKTSLGQPGPEILQLRLEAPGAKLLLVELARRARRRLRGQPDDGPGP